MLISKYFAVCKATLYEPFSNPLIPTAFISAELYNSMRFIRPNLCNIIFDKKRFEFCVTPLSDETESDNIFYSDHIISLPSNSYHNIFGFAEVNNLIIRTDIF
ncbi:MAG: hypothetical protein WC376_00050 [Candidatus Nanoarchaeia archaeon]|jgi:hypothetical protein